jgi:Flp pilus assembly protein TadG
VSDREIGSVTAFAVVLSLALAVLLGLVVEGGQVLSAREMAMGEVEQAARAGAAQLSPATLHAGGIMDGGYASIRTAQAVMAADGHPGTAWASSVGVTAAIIPYRISTPLLGLAGFPSMMITARASAAPVTG